jgi:hypothetical protein
MIALSPKSLERSRGGTGGAGVVRASGGGHQKLLSSQQFVSRQEVPFQVLYVSPSHNLTNSDEEHITSGSPTIPQSLLLQH